MDQIPSATKELREIRARKKELAKARLQESKQLLAREKELLSGFKQVCAAEHLQGIRYGTTAVMIGTRNARKRPNRTRQKQEFAEILAQWGVKNPEKCAEVLMSVAAGSSETVPAIKVKEYKEYLAGGIYPIAPTGTGSASCSTLQPQPHSPSDSTPQG